MLNSSENEGKAYINREMLNGLRSNLTQGVKMTSSVAGGYLKFGANALASGADKVGRNINVTAISSSLLTGAENEELNEEKRSEII